MANNLRLKLLSIGEEGFSLMEMMIVIAIIGLLGAIVGTNIMNRFDEARVDSTKTQIRQLSLALQDFRRVCGFYPTTEMGLDALLKPPVGRECKGYDPDGYLANKKLPQDAWNHDFQYFYDGNKFEIKSLGADAKEGGTGVNADISSNDL